jgi:hypothetical protein
MKKTLSTPLPEAVPLQAAPPAVHCAHDALVPLGKLKPHPRNPNKHPPRQIQLLAKLIAHQGWRAPIVVSRRSGLIVSGHGRLDAAKALGLKEAPVNYQDFESEEEERAHLIADNKIAELAEIDNEVLKGLYAELNASGFDLELLVFEQLELAARLAVDGAPGALGDAGGLGGLPARPPKAAFRTMIIHFPDQAAVDALAGLLKKPILEKTRFLWFGKKPDA